MIYGYARVSTDGQETATQVAALKRAGADRIVQEKRSGVLARPRLDELLGRVECGDVLMVWKVDRLARSLRGLLEVAEVLQLRGVALRSVTEPIDTGTPIGRAFFQLLGVFAELERSLIRERCAAGTAEARARGVRFGRPRSFDYSQVVALRGEGVSWVRIGRLLGVPASSARAAFKRMSAHE